MKAFLWSLSFRFLSSGNYIFCCKLDLMSSKLQKCVLHNVLLLLTVFTKVLANVLSSSLNCTQIKRKSWGLKGTLLWLQLTHIYDGKYLKYFWLLCLRGFVALFSKIIIIVWIFLLVEVIVIVLCDWYIYWFVFQAGMEGPGGHERGSSYARVCHKSGLSGPGQQLEGKVLLQHQV